jgi:hypothetical protein
MGQPHAQAAQVFDSWFGSKLITVSAGLGLPVGLSECQTLASLTATRHFSAQIRIYN